MGEGIQFNEKGPGAQYRALTRLSEEAEMPWDEMEVQRLWFEQAYVTPLRTLDGEEVEILQPGFWNRSGGPDFSHAALRTASGRVECGAVEVHLEPQDWVRHHHDRDRHYDPVILHVVWQAGPKPFFPVTRAGGVVRQVELSSQLRLPLEAVRRAFRTTAEERGVGARLGRCHAELERIPEADRRAILEEAGWYRFHRRVEQMRARVAMVGWEQVLWQGLADALGYAANRDAFGWLARRLPIGRVLKIRASLEREAWLYGVAGLLPDRWERTPVRSWPRQVWDHWWPYRGGGGIPELPSSRWVRRGQRPVNRPERRMAVLAALGEKARWREFVRLVKSGDGDGLGTLLGAIEHEYWSHRLAWGGKRTARPLALMGPERIASFLFNAAWPLAWEGNGGGLSRAVAAARARTENRPERVAAVRLLGGRRGRRSLLVQEGLIQIYQDFCLRDHRQCDGCDFPGLVRRWSKGKAPGEG